MTSKRSRETAYADLVAGLLDVRTDAASTRFDAEIAAAEEEGRIDAQTAKVLRWWQRESIRGLVEHARTVVPATLMALEQSSVGAGAEAEASSRSWARAVGDDLATPSGTSAAAAQTSPVVDLTAAIVEPTDLGERRRRMLVAGLTRVHSDR